MKKYKKITIFLFVAILALTALTACTGQAVSEEKGEAPPEPEKDCLIDLPIDAHIPESYISGMPQRLQIYRRIADIKSKEDALKLRLLDSHLVSWLFLQRVCL